MVKKSDINRLMNKKKLRGDQLGRLLLSNLIDQVQGKPERVSVEEINKMMDNLENRYEGLVYNTYVNIYAEVVDAYNTIQSEGVNAQLGLTNIKMNLALIARSAISRKAQLDEPVLITERQFRRYKTNYKKFLKDTIKGFKEEKESVRDYLISWLETVSSDIEAYDGNEDYPNTTKVIAKYSKEPISSKWDAPLRKIYKDSQTAWNKKYFDPVRIIHELAEEETNPFFDLNYRDAIEQQAKERNLDTTYFALLIELKDLYNHAKFTLNMDDKDILNYIDEKADINLTEVFIAKNHKAETELPEDLTKLDVLEALAFENGKTNEDQEQLAKFNSEELSDIYDALTLDLIHQHPAMKDLFGIKDENAQPLLTDKILNKEVTGAQLAKAGDEYYKALTSITSLRKEQDYGIWNVFPERKKKQARMKGFSVYHGDSIITRAKTDMIEDDPDPRSKIFMNELEDLSDSADSLKKSYQSIETYLKNYQSYSAFIEGIATYARLDDFLSLKITPEYARVIKEIDSVLMMFNLALSQLKAVLDKSEFEKQLKKIKKTYPMINPEKPRIKKSSKSALASYIGKIFSVNNKKPVITSVLFDHIAEGVNDDK